MATVDYKVVKNFFTKEELNILQKYCYIKLDKFKDHVIEDFKNAAFSPSWYDDPLMLTLLHQKLPRVEIESNLKLYPTFTYWRYYILGGTLPKHTDRAACEVSITVCVKKYDNWPMIIEGKKIELEEGDGLLYAGCSQKHWRPGIYKGEGMAQVFFHYVDQNGPFKKYAYDKRYLVESTKEVRNKR
tara:strand:- start:3742 stop:4299 length:558 start_codon:yes stop_codon:yes gene_type:complete